MMWTVEITLTGGGGQSFGDGRRHSRELGERAYRYEYEVDPITEALRVYRTQMTCSSYNASGGFWDADGPREEVAYLRASMWETVRGT